MRELDEGDLLVLCANALELHEAFDLMAWFIRYPAPPIAILHPSIQWWVKANAPQVMAMLGNEFWKGKR